MRRYLPGLLAAVACLALAPAAYALDFESQFGRSPDAHAFGLGSNLSTNGIAFEADGDVLAVDSSTTSGIYQVQVRSPTGTWKANIGVDPTHATGPRENGELSFPSDVAVAPTGDVLVMDETADRVVVFEQLTPDTYTFKAEFGSAGTGLGQFSDARGIAMATDGSFYVSDFALDRITKFNSAGVAQYAYSAPGPADLDGPMDVDVRGTTLYAGEWNSVLRITRLTDNGSSIALAATTPHFGSTGSGTGQFSKVAGVAAGPDGRVYVADDAEIEVFRAADGVHVARLTACCSGGTIKPRGIGYGNGGIYAFDTTGSTGFTRLVRYVNRLPTANFTSAPAPPNPPAPNETITLTSTAVDNDPATSTSSIVGSIALVEWDLDGDGAYNDPVTTGNSTTTSFATAGPHTIGQRVTDNEGGVHSTTKVVTVVANQLPVAAASATPSPAVTGETVSFSVVASDPDGSVANIEWDLDDNGTFELDSDTASRSFPAAGTPTIAVRVTDNKGAATIDGVVVTVTLNQAPTVTVVAAPTSLPSGGMVTFTASPNDPDGRPTQLAWDLDNDGAYDDATGTTATASRQRSGQLLGKARVTDSGGATGTGEAAATVTNRPPSISVSAAGTTTAGVARTLTATATDPDGTVAAIAWDLDSDGAFDDATGAQPSVTFAAAGQIAIKARVTDDEGATADAATTVTVNAPPVTPPPAPPPAVVPPPPPPDTTRPTAVLTLPPAVRTTTPDKAATTGIPVPLTCSEACKPSGVLLIARSVATKLKLKGFKLVGGKAVVGRASVKSLGANRFKLVLKLDARTRTAFKRSRLTRLSVTMRIEIKDVAGNITVLDRKVTIKRRK